jgi:hypothetical protein
MSDDYLAAYLTDHLAGSKAGLELIDHIARLHAGDAIERFVMDLKAEIDADRKALEELMARLDINPSRSKNTAAWMSSKFTELKVRLADQPDGPFRRFELWEALSLGIEGKRLLWRTLRTAMEGRTERGAVDLEQLEERAERQRRDVEEWRLDAARSAFAVKR